MNTDLSLKPNFLERSEKPLETEFLYGGTFDPVHNGHIAVINALVALDPEIRIRLIPCAIPALKKQPTASFSQRCQMLQLATASFSHCFIDKREACRQKASYTVETLQSIQQEVPSLVPVLVVGMDTLEGVMRWYQWEQLPHLCQFIVINRPGYDNHQAEKLLKLAGFEVEKNFAALKQRPAGSSFVLNMKENELSSTKIRYCLKINAALDSMLPESVIEYVEINRLYMSDKS